MTQWRGARTAEAEDESSLTTTAANRTVAFTWPSAVSSAPPASPGTQQLDLSDPEAIRAGLGMPRARDTQTGIAHEVAPPVALPFRPGDSQPPLGERAAPPPSESPASSGTFLATPGPASVAAPSTERRPSKAWGTAWSMAGRQTIGQYLQSQQQTAAQSSAPAARAPLAPLLPPPDDAALVRPGALAASDAAADPESVRHPGQIAPIVAASSEVPDLLWFDAKSTTRVRVWHRELLDQQRVVAFDERLALNAESPQDFKVRSEILAVLTQSSIERGDVGHLVHEGLSPTGHYVAPLVTLEGWLSFTFSEADELRALIGQAEVHRGQQPELAQAIDGAQKVLDSPATAAVQRTLTRATRFVRSRLRLAIGTEASRRLDQDVEEILLEQRSYKKRTFLGVEWLRTAIVRSTGETVTYLPASLAEQLPLFATMRCRVVAEVIPQQDHHEASPVALRTVALARLLPPAAFARRSDS